jgi:hypothetical protein
VSTEDAVQVRLTNQTHAHLTRLQEDGVFPEMRDGYRFGIALAIARGKIAPEDTRLQRTVFGIGTLDPAGLVRDAICELFPEAADQPYRYAERLAEYGIAELGRLHENRALRFSEIFRGIVPAPTNAAGPQDGSRTAD